MKTISKKTILIILGIIIGAAGSVYAVAVWNGTNRINSGEIVRADDIKNNFDYLYQKKADKPDAPCDAEDQVIKWSGNSWVCLDSNYSGDGLWSEENDGVHLTSDKDDLYVSRRLRFPGSSGTVGMISYDGWKMYLNGSLSVYNGNLDVNNKIKMLKQTTDYDPNNVVVTKGYLNQKLTAINKGGVNGSSIATPPVCTGNKFLQWNGNSWVCRALIESGAKRGDVIAGCPETYNGSTQGNFSKSCWGGAIKGTAFKKPKCPIGSALKPMKISVNDNWGGGNKGYADSFLCIKN